MRRRQAAQERRSEISEIVSAKGFIRIDELAEHFGVTAMTIHRDLDELDARGVVSKVRSGAKATPIEEVERNVALRRHHMLPQKRAMAAAALAWLDALDAPRVVALDDSTSALTLVDELAARDGLTIVSNFLPVIEQVAASEHATMFGLGGTFSPAFQSFQGSSTHEAIRSIQIDVFFLSATAVGQGAIFHPEEGPLQVKRTLIDQAARSVLLVDHTKFSRRALHRQAGLAEMDAVVVDDSIDPDDLRRLRDHVETVIVAETEQES
ncbi:DeoR/GlpR family DNA-binding transcription regulator [Ruania alba]|uniref:DNA-binding transcriptional regulator of sugar metabolism, DeoR/GlpR family n=1 Tax=Ruania alba TaxID=648782 RepID=A0A1H5LQ33_9MICO|nr:DeoR/GlpR family DNA-binding transcription regulator [Ruania alba]SEE79166.1 DNA-binding transcriptional regulator of sugar metabolism, DeoR/GlpR family [Ruania alba]